MSNILAMEKYIKKSEVNAEIKRLLKSAEAYLKYHHDINDKSVYAFRQQQLVMCELLSFLDNLEMKEVNLEKEYKDFIKSDNGRSMFETAKHFFKLGMRVNNPITAADRGIAEEIIITLKQVEKDYLIDLTKAIEWTKNQVKEGE